MTHCRNVQIFMSRALQTCAIGGSLGKMIDFLNRVYAGAYPPSRARSCFDSDISVDYDFKNNVPLE